MSENQTEIKRQKNNGGYIALMATIIISAILLIMVTQESFSGWHARFNVLGTEQKEQAIALSDGCINQAITGLVAGLPYQKGATSTTPRWHMPHFSDRYVHRFCHNKYPKRCRRFVL